MFQTNWLLFKRVYEHEAILEKPDETATKVSGSFLNELRLTGGA